MRTNIIFTLSLLLVGLLTGCSEQKKERQTIEQEIARWSGRRILLPATPVFLRYALDTVPSVLK